MKRTPAAAAEHAALRLQVGGTLVPGRDLYIARPEDELLFQLLSACEYVNVLASRQVGKSSLMLSTAFRLREQGGRFAVVDLTVLGTPDNAPPTSGGWSANSSASSACPLLPRASGAKTRVAAPTASSSSASSAKLLPSRSPARW
jgi:hypothetical protein